MPTIAIGIGKTPQGNPTATVPVDALSEDGVPPEENDKVSFSVEGTVQSVSGQNATISIDSINGEPVGEGGGESGEDEEDESDQNQTPQASSPAFPNRSPLAPGRALAPMGGAMPPAPGGALAAPLRNRLNRAGTNAMRNRLMAGARGQPLM